MEVCTVGGYNEVGKNMLAVKSGEEVVILDMGLDLEPYITYTDNNEVADMSAFALTSIGALPNIKTIADWHDNVIAIVPTHAHLDHIGAIPYIGRKFKAPIICTKFTGEVIRSICDKDSIKLKNELKILGVNSKLKLSKNITIEFINMTHSIPETVAIAIHTPEGVVVYATDFKFDTKPVLGKKSNLRRLKQLGKKGVKLLVVDSLRSKQDMKTPSESVAKDMLREVLLGADAHDKALVVTTFSSHLARLKSIVECGEKLKRNVVFMGRSLARYAEAGEEAGIIKFSDKVEICKFRKHVERRLKKISKDKGKYLIVCTGHQGEPKAILPRIVNGEIEFNFNTGDHVVFSCTVIPNEQNRENRAELENALKRRGVKLFKDIHVSGHPGKQDLRELFEMLKPEHIIPCHGDISFSSGVATLLEEMKEEYDCECHLMVDEKRLKL